MKKQAMLAVVLVLLVALGAPLGAAAQTREVGSYSALAAAAGM